MCIRDRYEPGAIICTDISEERLELVRSRKLADQVLNPLKEDTVEAVRAMTGGRGADVVIEAAGGEDTFRMAWAVSYTHLAGSRIPGFPADGKGPQEYFLRLFPADDRMAVRGAFSCTGY